MAALKMLKKPDAVAALRGKTLAEIRGTEHVSAGSA